MADTETLDRLYLEWSQFTHAVTARELKLIDALHAGLQWMDNVGVLDKDELESYRDNVMEQMRAALR